MSLPTYMAVGCVLGGAIVYVFHTRIKLLKDIIIVYNVTRYEIDTTGDASFCISASIQYIFIFPIYTYLNLFKLTDY